MFTLVEIMFTFNVYRRRAYFDNVVRDLYFFLKKI